MTLLRRGCPGVPAVPRTDENPCRDSSARHGRSDPGVPRAVGPAAARGSAAADYGGAVRARPRLVQRLRRGLAPRGLCPAAAAPAAEARARPAWAAPVRFRRAASSCCRARGRLSAPPASASLSRWGNAANTGYPPSRPCLQPVASRSCCASELACGTPLPNASRRGNHAGAGRAYCPARPAVPDRCQAECDQGGGDHAGNETPAHVGSPALGDATTLGCLSMM